MLNILHKMTTYIKRKKRYRFRDTRGHYPSNALSCLRDQYWAATGVKRTNETDYLGSQRMFIGSALEDGLVKEYLSNLGIINVHLLGTQVPVGSSNPNWNGYLDALVGILEDGKLEKYCLEIKTKTGFGASLMARQMEPQDSHLAQIGLYLKDLHNKDVTNEGILLYYLLADSAIGCMVAIHCRYNPEKDEVEAYFAENTQGKAKQVSFKQSIGAIEARWLKLEQHIKDGTCPPGDFKYKHDYTPEYLRTLSDARIKKIISNSAVVGDWQVIYSPYKDKQFEVDGITPGNTMEERRRALVEYKRRYPKSKLTIGE